MWDVAYQLHPLITLALVVAHRDINLCLAVADTYHSCRFVNSTLQFPFVPVFVRIWVLGILPAVPGDAVGGVVAIRSVQLNDLHFSSCTYKRWS
jgi:hypothetical protein